VFFRQVLYRDLGCASYVLGDGGEAIVVDPRLDIDVYLEIAAQERLRIAHVIDTHDHADHVSGLDRLAARTGAVGHRPHIAGEPCEDDLRAGDQLHAGAVRVVALAAPGHRPEHLALAVTDTSRSPDPWMLLSGDSLLVGDIARPDLAVQAREGARELHASLQRLLALGDHVEVWPGHIGGSLCGGAGLSGKSSSTIGYERRANRLLSLPEEQFVHALTTSLPVRPPNVEHIVRANRSGYSSGLAQPQLLSAHGLAGALQGVTVLDARDPARFDQGHIPGALNLPVSAPNLGTRAGWALSPQEPIVIAAEDEQQAHRMTLALHAVGLWNVRGVALDWSGLALVGERSLDLPALAAALALQSVSLVDVRERSEWRAAHVQGSTHLPLARLGDGRGLSRPSSSATVAVACAAGARAAFAASLLRRGGWHDVVRVSGGGIAGLAEHGVPLLSEQA
jgi:glyoxylase-like metal-dependent hydrolase (beta-lactamase superfamily II)/rhodanese-related sulfurtransferase